MTDRFERAIDYLRISVTDRCNLRCVYCMPPEGITLRGHSDMLTYDEIVTFATLAVSKGVQKIRITGGEPLVRKDLELLITMLAKIEGVTDLALTTNGQLLKEKAPLLKSAGLHRVNISLDTLDPELYSKITRGGVLEQVLEGIHTAQQVGLHPIKINCVTGIDFVPDTESKRLQFFADTHKLQIRFIRRMSLAQGTFSLVEGGSGGDCPHCNRLRLTSDGMLKPCLFSDLAYNIRTLGFIEALEAAVQNKPLQGTYNRLGSFYGIGG